jgi:aminoglycoside 6'-N-acetyltransferase
MKIQFRRFIRTDLATFAAWLRMPHVARWWHESSTDADVENQYGPSVDGVDPTTLWTVEVDGVAVGMIQSYRVDDYPEHAESVQQPPGAIGIDYMIGEPDCLGHGIGAAMIAKFVAEVIPTEYPGATAVVSDPSVENVASIRALERAGFSRGPIVPGEDGPEQIMFVRFAP